jgi:hypothetical protein
MKNISRARPISAHHHGLWSLPWHRLFSAFCLFGFSIWSAHSQASGGDYQVSINSNLDRIDVRACFQQGMPRELAADKRLQSQLRGDFYVDGKSIRPRFRGERLILSARHSCFRYQVELDLDESKASFGRSYRVGRDVVTKPQHWLIQPRRANHSDDIQIRFDLPPGVAVSVPWPEMNSAGNTNSSQGTSSQATSNQTTYRLAMTDANWDAQVAFGHFHVEYLDIANTQLRLAVLDSTPAVNMDDTRRWVLEAAASTLSVHGHFPQPMPQALVVPVGPRGEAVPFARVLRGGSVALQFYIDPTRPFREFSEDWTATHEFSHLLLPYVSRRDAWLSEGLASYMQNVLRARDGRISERTAWNKLYAGFQRGMKATRRENSGAFESRSRTGWSTMRVYWGGAAIWFLADVELRRRSNGQQTVDTVLDQLHDCCMDPGKLWRAKDLMRTMDQLSNDTVFSELYDRYAHSSRFPAVEPTLAALGVDTRRSSVRLRNHADEVHIRSAIMQTP